jgi:hypothetical protein
LREAMKKSQVDKLFTTIGKLADLDPALSEAEIDAKIAAARADRARRRLHKYGPLDNQIP